MANATELEEPTLAFSDSSVTTSAASSGARQSRGASRQQSHDEGIPRLAQRRYLQDEDVESLSLPPVPAGGGVLEVDFRLTVFHIGKVDTREQTSAIKMGMVFYWNDPRMVGWTSPILPGTLWGPEASLRNAIGGVSVEYEQFVVADPVQGRLKRIINYEALVITPMDLRLFPFDVQCLTPEFVSISHWRQLDLQRGGSLSRGQSYRLIPLRRKSEGEFIMMFWNGAINEWDLHSYSTQVLQKPSPAGFTMTLVQVRFHIIRAYTYYLVKTVVPLIVLTVASHLVILIPPSDIADRLACAFTIFVANFALLYVVGEHVPRVDFLTKIDRIVFLTLFMLLWFVVSWWCCLCPYGIRVLFLILLRRRRAARACAAAVDVD